MKCQILILIKHYFIDYVNKFKKTWTIINDLTIKIVYVNTQQVRV